MDQVNYRHSLVLDAPGTAGPKTLRRSAILATVILALAVIIMGAGSLPLPPYPQFTVFHATFVFVIDLVTAFLLFGQFVYCRLLSYVVLAAAFLFSALVNIPFLLSFPGAVWGGNPIIGGSQSAIWVWHVWHIVLPATIGLSVVVHRQTSHAPVQRELPVVAATVGLVLLGVLVVVAVVTVFHDRLPVLYTQAGAPLTFAFYMAGGMAALVTLIALWLTLPHVLERSILHIWIAMVLLALLADVGASLSAFARYTVGWYFGRIEAMLASSVLLVVFLADINRLYRDLVDTALTLSASNEEKDGLLAEVRRREQEFEALAEKAPDIIARVDRTQRLRYINPAIEKLTGKPREWFRDRSVAELGLPPKELALRKDALEEVFESGREQALEHEYRLAEATRYFHARLAPEFDSEGQVESVLVMERDITDLKQAQFSLEQLTLHDPLTGIANRRYLEQFVEREWRLEARHYHTVALIMADIDHFKAYNDHYGHQQGDNCLRQVAQVLQAHLHRAGDLLVRYGGEEFVVALLETDLSAAAGLATAMGRALYERQLPHAASPVAPVVTISLGVTAGPADRVTFSQMLNAADQALYRAKRNGRNRVEVEQAIPSDH